MSRKIDHRVIGDMIIWRESKNILDKSSAKFWKSPTICWHPSPKLRAVTSTNFCTLLDGSNEVCAFGKGVEIDPSPDGNGDGYDVIWLAGFGALTAMGIFEGDGCCICGVGGVSCCCCFEPDWKSEGIKIDGILIGLTWTGGDGGLDAICCNPDNNDPGNCPIWLEFGDCGNCVCCGKGPTESTWQLANKI